MNVNGIGKQPCYEKTNGVGKNQKNTGSSFSKSLSENLNDRVGNGQVKEENVMPASPLLNTAYPYRNVAPAADIPGNSKAVKTCEARRVTYLESDHVRSCAGQGFALMAQVDVDSRSVYVEQKLENGTVKGYEVSIDEVAQDTTDPIERMALEAWEKKEPERKKN